MANPDDRDDFREWIDGLPDPGWPTMPLTHITKAFVAQDVARRGKVEPNEVGPLATPLAYMFYGRPGYRVSGDGSVKVAAACPVCFVFDPSILARANKIHSFDTGAFGKRLYSHVMLEEMNVGDFEVGTDISRPNKLIAKLYGSRASYFDGDTAGIGVPSSYAPEWNFLAHAYVQLLASKGRNEPDDRVGSIEVAFSDPVPLQDALRAIVVPHSIWNDTESAPWLTDLRANGVEILPYKFAPGKAPEHYFTLIEFEVRSLFRDWGHL